MSGPLDTLTLPKGRQDLNTPYSHMDEAVDRGHSIKIVAQRTGLSSHVIRVWERRYKAVTPKRTTTNRRLYSDDDVNRLRLLAEATENGHTISNIADLSDEKLRTLIQDDRPTIPRYQPPPGGDPKPHLKAAILATRELDADALHTALERASLELTQLVVLEDVIVPLMHRIGELWHDGELRVLHEHTAYAVVSFFVSSLKTAYAPTKHAPTVVIATPAGQLHELGALITAATAASDGWQTAYLGASLPAEEIARTAELQGAAVVALSVVYPADDPTVDEELRRLRRLLPENTGLIVGGQSASAYGDVVREIDADVVSDLRSLRDHLAEYRQ